MTQPDYRGARGSNAGDDFHELWALRQCLQLLDPDTELRAVTVEGLRAEDEAGVSAETWDGVDSTLYFGGPDARSATRIDIQQFKYSSANPEQRWTASRLIRATNRSQDNSVIAHFGKAFARLSQLRPDLIERGDLHIRLVSNQPLDPALERALSPSPPQEVREQDLRRDCFRASGLNEALFAGLLAALDLSHCGTGSRFQIESRVLTALSTLVEDDARASAAALVGFIHKKMLPEAKGEFIAKQDLLVQFGFSDPAGLFPCPSETRKTDNLVRRQAADLVTQLLLEGEQYLCVHGEGGCGKTTLLQQVQAQLPPGSVTVLFDCFGEGRYLDSDAYRHRPKDAFVQVCNDLARLLRTPHLVTSSPNLEYPRVFKKRLQVASDLARSRDPAALVLVVIDAADNSVTAAQSRTPPEPSFVHDFVRVAALPSNVRFVLTTRTGCLESLQLPEYFKPFCLHGFIPEETKSLLRMRWPEVPDTWIDDFQALSQGNPRVQRYALDFAGSEPQRALDYLRPDGRTLEAIFEELYTFATRKAGQDATLKTFCSGLAALPRPVPLEELAAVTEFSKEYIIDICSDLSPGIRLFQGNIVLADEDFEHFVRARAQTNLGTLQARIANRFIARHRTDSYAATHLASALLAAQRGPELVALVQSEGEPEAIGDPVLRREAHLHRLQLAMRVCRDAGNLVDATLTALSGAEALKTGTFLRNTLRDNPDLTAAFARDSAARIILRDPEEVEAHGPLLFHLMERDARDRDHISVRDLERRLGSWLQRRSDALRERRKNGISGWEITFRHIAAETEAILRVAGPAKAVAHLLRWRPRWLVRHVARVVASTLATMGDLQLLERCLTEGPVRSPWDLFLLTPLAIATGHADVSRLETSLKRLGRRGLRLSSIERPWDSRDPSAAELETVLTACELVIAHGGNRGLIAPLLDQFASAHIRDVERLSTSQTLTLDLSLRAYALSERLAGRQATLASYLVSPPQPSGTDPADKRAMRQARQAGENAERLRTLLGPVITLYDVRAQVIVGAVSPQDAVGLLRQAVERLARDDYELSRSPDGRPLRSRAAVSLARLMAVPGLDRPTLVELTFSTVGIQSGWLDAHEIFALEVLALDRSTHAAIVRKLTAATQTVAAERVSAEEKCALLLSLCRLLLPVSITDARAVFHEILRVAGGVNEAVMDEIRVVSKLVERASDSMGAVARRTTALHLATLVSDAAVRLSRADRFPWSEAIAAVTTLDVCAALAVVARWADSGLRECGDLLPDVLLTAVRRNAMSSVQAITLLPLLDRASDELLKTLARAAAGHPAARQAIELLAYDELLRFGRGARPDVSAALTAVNGAQASGKWTKELSSAVAFQEARVATKAVEPPPSLEEDRGTDPIQAISWEKRQFVTTSDIETFLAELLSGTQDKPTYIPRDRLLQAMAEHVPPEHRVAHLEALLASRSEHLSAYAIVSALSVRLGAWSDSLSVLEWCRTRLLDVILTRLPILSQDVLHDDARLHELLVRTTRTPPEIAEAFIRGIEIHGDTFDASMIYGLASSLAPYLTPEQATELSSRYVERLVNRIGAADRDPWTPEDLPTTEPEGLSRFIYSIMGDIDVALRWRAAHSVRRLALLGEQSAIESLIAQYDRNHEVSFRDPSAPFYWLAARLWLVVALDRIASEHPHMLFKHARRLFEIATDRRFPHLLVRAFAKSASLALMRARLLPLTRAERTQLARANAPCRQVRGLRPPRPRAFDRYHPPDASGRRFHFDALDTLPYWYSPAVGLFSDVTQEEFLGAAEHWILDEWRAAPGCWRWDQEKRRSRFEQRRYLLANHGHGSRPTVERFGTHLEWHAMWCVVGELLRTRSLARASETERGITEWLTDEMLSYPPFWLSDLRGPKPLEPELWCPPPGNEDDWVESGIPDGLVEIGLAGGLSLNVGASHETGSSHFYSHTRLSSALVSPGTASALLRALQTARDPSDFGFPAEGRRDKLAIHRGPYRLEGWLSDSETRNGIDEGDPLAYGVHSIQLLPGSQLRRVLQLSRAPKDTSVWSSARLRGRTGLVFRAWGDTVGGEREDERRHSSEVRSTGWRLSIERTALKEFLAAVHRDLLVSVKSHRRNRGYGGYDRYEEEEPKERHSHEVFLLRQDGAIETVNGRVGTWTGTRT